MVSRNDHLHLHFFFFFICSIDPSKPVQIVYVIDDGGGLIVNCLQQDPISPTYSVECVVHPIQRYTLTKVNHTNNNNEGSYGNSEKDASSKSNSNSKSKSKANQLTLDGITFQLDHLTLMNGLKEMLSQKQPAKNAT